MTLATFGSPAIMQDYFYPHSLIMSHNVRLLFAQLSVSIQVAFQHFQELDEHISYVATKVCHLGDQLEGVNTPRQRAVEAQRLMTYFNEFLDGELRSDVFNNPEKVRIHTLPSTHM